MLKKRTMNAKDTITRIPVMMDEAVVSFNAVLIKSRFSFFIKYSTALRKRFFRLIRAPDIEISVVIIMAARNSPETIPNFVLKNGVIFRMSRIIIRNIINTEKKTRVSLTEISVETFFRFSPKKVPIRVCQVSEMMIVSFHGLRFGFSAESVFGIWYLVFGSVWAAVAIGRINVANRISIMIPLFMFWLVVLDLNNLVRFGFAESGGVGVPARLVFGIWCDLICWIF